jgi:hypothetical protein
MQTEGRMQLIIDIKKIEYWMAEYSPPKRQLQQDAESEAYKYKLLVSFGSAALGKRPLQKFHESKRLWVEDLEDFEQKAQVERLLRSYRGSLEKLGRKGKGFTEYSKLKIGLLEDFCIMHHYSLEKVIRSEILSDEDESVEGGHAVRVKGKQLFGARAPPHNGVLEVSESAKQTRLKMKKRRKARHLRRVERQDQAEPQHPPLGFSNRDSKPGSPAKSDCRKTAKTSHTEQVISTKAETARRKTTQEKCEILKQAMIGRLEEQLKAIKRMKVIYLSWEDVITYLGVVSKNIMDYQFDD